MSQVNKLRSALCKELLNAPGGFGDDRPVHTLMGDLVKGKYWPKVADEHCKKPQSIMLADKNAPNEDVWRQQVNGVFLNFFGFNGTAAVWRIKVFVFVNFNLNYVICL